MVVSTISRYRRQISLNGGEQPRWRDDGKELFYVQDDTIMLAVAATMGQTLNLGQPQRLFQTQDLNFRGYPWAQYDVSADGQRFLTSTPVAEEAPSVRIVENWYEEFRGPEP